MRIFWMVYKDALTRIGINSTTIEQNVRRLKLKHLGHIKHHDTLVTHIVEEKKKSKRERGRLTRRWEQDMEDDLEATTTQAGRLAEDRVLLRGDRSTSDVSQRDLLSRRKKSPVRNFNYLFMG